MYVCNCLFEFYFYWQKSRRPCTRPTFSKLHVHVQCTVLYTSVASDFIYVSIVLSHEICYSVYMLCAKFGSGQSEDCPAQTSHPSFAWTIRELAIYSPTHYFLCDTCMLIERWHIVAVEQQTKISFLSRKKVRSKFLTRESVFIKSMYRNALYADCIGLL